MTMNLLTTYEVFEFEPETMKEAVDKTGRPKMMLKGIIQKADTLNQNGRVYPRSILEREVKNYQKFIAENRALGELDHPESSVVNLKNVSHIMRSAVMEGDVVRGSLEVLDTPSGQTLRSLVESGVKIGISSRGVGSTQRQGDYHVVQNDFQLICFDVVSEPSTPQAFVLPEGKRIDAAQLKNVFNKWDMVDRVINDILGRR